VELTSATEGPVTADDGGAGPFPRARTVSVGLFVGVVFTAGVVCLGVTVAAQATSLLWESRTWHVWLALAGLLMVGELYPLQVPRGDDDTDRITVSSTFATALVLVGPLSFAMAVQAIAVAIDDLRLRKRPKFIAFNIGQYLVTLFGARLVFSTVSGHPLLAISTPLAPADLTAALLAGGAYFILNNGLVALAVSLDSGASAWAMIREDIRVQGVTSAILLGLAPVAAQAATFSVLMLPLLLLPIIGVHHNAKLVLRRQHEALHDPLTDLPNRELLRRRLDRALTEMTGRHRVAVMVLDLDHFKEINDTLGHHVGDQVIREVARRLVDYVPAGASVARLGGDEFAILCPLVGELLEVEALGAAICERLQEPAVIDGVRLTVAGSIGVAVAPDHADSVETLLKRADIALYRAKNRRGEVRVYGHDIDGHTLERLSLLSDLHTGLDNGEFVLHFQPILATGTGQVTGVEALMRWMHPRQGLVGPDLFIPLAENTNLIGSLTRMAIASAAIAQRTWSNQGFDLNVAVNLSARLLSDTDLPVWIGEILSQHGMPAGRLTIEVTESTIMSDPKRATEVLARLRQMGIVLAIDDYGTGYSSLAYLRRLSVQQLKIDKSFVIQMGSDENSAIIVRSTIDLAHNLGLTVTAEGVEDAHTLHTLTELGCDQVQGFHFSRPVSADTLTAWLAQRALQRTP
jgi:diguanylate cyclase (GGDEF)-like protein